MYTLLVSRGAVANVDGAVLERLPSHRDTRRDADQVRVGEFLARSQVAVVQENGEAGLVEELGDPAGLLLEPGERDYVDVVGRDARGPGDPCSSS